MKIRNASLIDFTTDDGAAGSCSAFMASTIGRSFGGVRVDVMRAQKGMERAKLYNSGQDGYNYVMAFQDTTGRFTNSGASSESISSGLQACAKLRFY